MKRNPFSSSTVGGEGGGATGGAAGGINDDKNKTKVLHLSPDQKRLMEQIFDDRIRQFDAKRWKKIAIYNCCKRMYFYAVMNYEKKEVSGKPEDEVAIYLCDKDEYDRLRKKWGKLKGKGSEFLNEDGSAFYTNDIITINIAGTSIDLNDGEREIKLTNNNNNKTDG